MKTLAARRAVWLIALVTLTSSASATDRFALLIEALCASVAASHARGLAGPVIVLIWGRLRRMAARFAAAVAAIPAAPGRASRPAQPRPALSSPARSGSGVRDARPRLPGGFGWLIRLSPAAACHGGQLQRLLADPEMAALLAATPRMGRLLRPLCRMLAVEPPPGLLAPPSGASRPARAARAGAPGEAATPSPFPIRPSRAERAACRDPYRRRPCDLWLEPPRRRAAAGDDGAGDTGPGLAAVGTDRLAPA